MKVSHCFNLNGQKDPTIKGLNELINEYRKANLGTEMWGPTMFEPTLRKIKEYMEFNLANRMYHILLMITDGCIHDMRETIDRIVDCSKYPLSIIIVGIGDADFSMMDMLDSDDYELVDGKGMASKRDIV